jgi:hypothetical protein
MTGTCKNALVSMTIPSVGTYQTAIPTHFGVGVDFGVGAAPDVCQMVLAHKLAPGSMVSTPSNAPSCIGNVKAAVMTDAAMKPESERGKDELNQGTVFTTVIISPCSHLVDRLLQRHVT